jgi:transglutaminase-like putative cysteine protease
LRASATGAVCVSIAACVAEGELAVWYGALVAALVCAGGAFSYVRRTRPLPHLKILLGAAMLGAFAWFFVAVSSDAAAGQLSGVVSPLAALFAAMQAAHSFDMTSRRDLGFSLAGSATLIAVAGAQAIDLSFGVYVALWAALTLAGLHAIWSSMAGGTPPRPVPVAASTAAALLVAVLLVAFLPAPRPPSASVVPNAGGTPATITASRVVPAPGSPAQLPASASGPTGVGGFLGFAGPLDTAVRAGLGDEVVMHVRADRPTYWVAETFDSWSGRSWSETDRSRVPARGATGSGGRRDGSLVLTGGSPFVVAPGIVPDAVGGSGTSTRSAPARDLSGVRPDYQTFYLAAGASDLVLHADQATAVWIPVRRLLAGTDDTIRTRQTLGPGSVYTVVSTVATPSDSALARWNGTAGLTPGIVREDLALPHHYPRVAALARRITAHDSSVVAKVHALERWIGAHTKYTLDIPPLPAGHDTVVQFLFATRRGYCEQISTSLAVMLRTLGIPAREAVGYVPGPFDPITGLYDEEAKDAHAWVQVWFPGYGWQSFDPTAFVSVANPSPATTIGHDLAAALRRVPVLPTVSIAAGAGLLWIAVAWRRRRPRGWRAKVTRQLERAARDAKIPTGPGDTLGSLAAALDDVLVGDARDLWARSGSAVRADAKPARDLASVAARAAWGDGDTRPSCGRDHVQEARMIRRAVRRHVRRATPARR